MKAKAKADHRDVIIGTNLRSARHVSEYTLEQLAGELNISSQQIQKYEKGINRVSAAMLYEIAAILKFPIIFFYSGLESDDLAPFDNNKAKEKDFFELYQLFQKLNGDKKRTSLKMLVKSLIDD